MTDRMIRLLFRWSYDGGEMYYIGEFQNGARDPHNDSVIGVCETKKYQRPDSAEHLETFKENVEDVAIDVRWFDEALGGDDR